MSAKPILYSLDYSPPARTVWLTARFLGLELEIRNVDLASRAQLSEEYVKLNPQHTVPTLDDNGVILWESAAICTYLIGKYGPAAGSPLYPNDLVIRARIDQRLYFNAAILFPLLRTSSISVLFSRKNLPETLIGDVGAAFDHLENFLAGGKYLVGDQLTLADLAVSATVSNLVEWAPLDDGRHKKVAAWLKRVADAVPFYEELNTKHAIGYGRLFRAVHEEVQKSTGAKH